MGSTSHLITYCRPVFTEHFHRAPPTPPPRARSCGETEARPPVDGFPVQSGGLPATPIPVRKVPYSTDPLTHVCLRPEKQRPVKYGVSVSLPLTLST